MPGKKTPKPVKAADGCVWITGASSGIGAALAVEMAQRGWTVIISARRADALTEIAARHENIIAVACDVTDRPAMAECVKMIEDTHGPIAMAVANAGIYLPTTLPGFDAEIFDRSFAVNITGTVNLLAPVVPLMTQRGKGQIVLVSSVAGYNGLPTSAAYGATKAALLNMGEAMAMDLRRSGVMVNMIAPGFVDTPATKPNKFKMPFLMDVELAARRIADGLAAGKTRLSFPRRFTVWLRLLTYLPRSWVVSLLGK